MIEKKLQENPLSTWLSGIEVPKNLKEDLKNLEGERIEMIEMLKKVNVFVGPNNSGKSLIIRSLIKESTFDYRIEQTIVAKIAELVKRYKNQLLTLLDKNKISAYIANSFILDHNLINSKIFPPSENHSSFTAYFKEQSKVFELLNVNYNYFQVAHSPRNNHQLNGIQKKELLDIVIQFKTEFNKLCEPFSSLPKLKRLYAPTLRTLRKFSTNVFTQKCNQEYGFTNIEIINGENFYNTLSDLHSGSAVMRQKKEDFELFLSEYFFEGQSITITPLRDKNEVAIKIGAETERMIYELGEGIQMIIILTFPIFSNECSIYGIEEPEIFLHPGLQKQLLKFFSCHPSTKNISFFITTHSNHFLDGSQFYNNISINTSVKLPIKGKDRDEKNANFLISNVAYGNENILNLLGVTNSSVFLSNCTLWVEGVTDMLYFRKFLFELMENDENYKWLKNVKEGVHYTYVFSAGDNIVHYDFTDKQYLKELTSKPQVKNICGKSFVIVDDDHKKNASRKKEFYNNLGGDFFVLPVVEVESLLSDYAIVQTIKTYPTVENADIPVANFLSPKERKNLRIGSYIDNNLYSGVQGKNKFKKFSANKDSDNSTIKEKSAFCKSALPFIKYESMTPESLSTSRKIADFIKAKNNL